ncbi:3-oxoacyl-[acyl-carrier-protein] reductase [soil metagenome]
MANTFGNALDFRGKVALVTGSSRGIGAGILTALANHGATCVVNYFEDPDGRNRADADGVAKLAGNARLVAGDISKPDDVQQMADTIKRDFGGLDILVNNAGVLRDRSIRKMTLDDFEAVMRVNLFGTFNMIKSFSDLMKPGGRIVNMASVAATLGFFGQANYAPSKAGVVALTKVAARELARNQITVNAIAPGVIETEMTKDFKPEVTEGFRSQIPLGRLGQVDDIVGAALFLCSDLARYITGQVIHVNGGFYMGTS